MSAVVNYFKESINELGKVNWPTRKQTIKLTLAVAVFSLTLALFMGTVDLVFNELVKRFIVEG